MELRKGTLIWLNSLGIQNITLAKLDYKLEGIENIHSTSLDYLKKIGLLKGTIISRIYSADYKKDIYEYMKLLKSNNIDPITAYDMEYPYSLKQIPDKPMVIYTKGRRIKNDDIKIAIVGSRKVSEYGKWATQKFTKELTDLGITIVSGLALGVDAIAHSVTGMNKGNTIGVLGNGLGRVYPKENLTLYEEVVENGTLLSEFPHFTQPDAMNFPARNRIISGLSMAVIVIEAEVRSGTLITARHALEQGKEVFALPGNINSRTSEGTNLLIKDGAKPLLNIDDILYEIALLKRLDSQRQSSNDLLSFRERNILDMLSDGRLHIDYISLRTGIDRSEISVTMEALIKKSIVDLDSDGYYCLR